MLPGRCGNQKVTTTLSFPLTLGLTRESDLFGDGLLLHLPTAERRVPTGNRLRTAEEPKVASAFLMDRHGACLGNVGFSLPSTVLTNLTSERLFGREA